MFSPQTVLPSNTPRARSVLGAVEQTADVADVLGCVDAHRATALRLPAGISIDRCASSHIFPFLSPHPSPGFENREKESLPFSGVMDIPAVASLPCFSHC